MIKLNSNSIYISNIEYIGPYTVITTGNKGDSETTIVPAEIIDSKLNYIKQTDLNPLLVGSKK